jgi:Plant transposon protein
MICSDKKPLAFRIRTLLYDIPHDSETLFLRIGVVTFRLRQTSTLIAYGLQLLFALLSEETTNLPTQSDLVDSERVYAQLGFPCAIWCVQCASWEWDECPVAWQGNHKGKNKKPCNRMDFFCDDYLYIWHVMFGTPGLKNDINSINYSTLFNKIRTGAWPPFRPETVISSMPLTWYYYLVDGIYPRFRFFVPTFSNPRI